MSVYLQEKKKKTDSSRRLSHTQFWQDGSDPLLVSRHPKFLETHFLTILNGVI